MAATYADTGLTPLLTQRNTIGAAFGTNIEARLYTAVSPAISKNSIITDFTEASGMGYVAKAVATADWSYALDTSNHWVIATAAKVWTFSAGAGLTLVGYYITVQLGFGPPSILLMAEAFASPIVIPAGGGTLTLTLNDKYQQC